MRMLSLLLSLVLLSLTVASIVELSKIWRHPIVIPSTHSLAGFDVQQNQIPGVPEINERMKERIITLKQQESSSRSYTIYFNLGVTILTALAAFIATVTTVRAVTKRSATIAIAVLTFLSTLVNYGQNHFTTEKEEATRKSEQVRKWRQELEALSPENIQRELPRYNNELDEL